MTRRISLRENDSHAVEDCSEGFDFFLKANDINGDDGTKQY